MILASDHNTNAFFSTKTRATFTTMPDCDKGAHLVVRFCNGTCRIVTFYHTVDEAIARAKTEAENDG